jgi:hypothetical protein
MLYMVVERHWKVCCQSLRQLSTSSQMRAFLLSYGCACAFRLLTEV